jgi:signal transduction histidine kinase
VLVVDDEPRSRELFRGLLEAHGYAVLTACSGVEGLALAREQGPDVVLLDVMMPHLDGLEVCRQLKGEERTAVTPVLLVTSVDARQERLRGVEAGANDFIIKPFDSTELLLRVRNAVRTKRLYERAAIQYRQLQALETARDGLVHMIVHDLRSPLTGLQAYLDLLLTSPALAADEQGIEFARESSAIVRRLSGMITQLLDLSRLESGKMPLSPQPVDLTELVRCAVATLGPPPCPLDLASEFEVCSEPVVCDADLISRVIANLVGNAYKFSPEGQPVRITIERRNGSARIAVSDRGPGVPPELQSHIFEKFVQGSNGRSGREASTGLGLAFCRLAVDAHGGRIGVESHPPEGSTFWIELPAAERPASVPRASRWR